MRGRNTLDCHPYRPLIRSHDLHQPIIVRLAPEETSLRLEFVPGKACPQGEFRLFYRERGENFSWQTESITNSTEILLTGLTPDTEYECKIVDKDGPQSETRLFRTGALPCGARVVNYLHPEDPAYAFSGRYLCSPSLARLPSGRLVVGMDLFGNHMAQNLTVLFSSEDDGRTFHYLTDLYPFYWGSLFVHRGILYILGLSTEYGNLQIASSRDEGAHWSAPVSLFYGSNVLCPTGGMHRAPMHMVHHAGRIWTTCEYGSWESGGHFPTVISFAEDDDPMIPENWVMPDFLPFEGEWKEAAGGKQGNTMEGNLVVTPEGKFIEILRWEMGKVLLLEVDDKNPETPLHFAELREAPVSSSMFRILPYRDGYLLITNRKGDNIPFAEGISYRNLLSVFFSKDLKHWECLEDVVDFSDKDPGKFGFQYPCPLLEGNRLKLAVRSAFNGAHSFHDSNYSLFFDLSLPF